MIDRKILLGKKPPPVPVEVAPGQTIEYEQVAIGCIPVPILNALVNTILNGFMQAVMPQLVEKVATRVVEMQKAERETDAG